MATTSHYSIRVSRCSVAGILVTPFCVIIDINLHDQSGIDLRRQLADKGVRLPVIFITGNDSDANRSAAIEAGCIAYLSKPFAARSLIEAVERALMEVC